jgi:hypothetical protein
VSNEGLRLEVATPSAARRLAPQFVVHVPVLRMGVPVQRVWVKSAPSGPNRTVQCGASLLATDERTIMAWKRLADPAGGPLFAPPRPAAAKVVAQSGLFGRVGAALASAPLVGALAPGSWRPGRS